MVGTMENALAQGITSSSVPVSPALNSAAPFPAQQQSSAPVTPVPERLFTLPAITPCTGSAPQLESVASPEPAVVTLDSSSPELLENSDDDSTVPGVEQNEPSSDPTSPALEERAESDAPHWFVELPPLVARNEEESRQLETADEHVGNSRCPNGGDSHSS